MLAEFTAPLSSALIVAAFTACVIPTSSACTISSFASRPNLSRSATDVLFCPIAGSASPPTANKKVQTRASFIDPAPNRPPATARTIYHASDSQRANSICWSSAVLFILRFEGPPLFGCGQRLMRSDMKVCRHQCATLASILFLKRQETAVAVAERQLFSAPSVLQPLHPLR